MASHAAIRQSSQTHRADPQRTSSLRAPARPLTPRSGVGQLQRTLGNEALQRFAQRIQPKLQIGKAGDVYEREADRVADAVMGMSNRDVSSLAVAPAASVGAQRKCAACESDSEEKVVRRAPAGGREGFVVPQATASRVESSFVGAGQPLSESARHFFEPRFGHDFSHVRVHADAHAAESARSIDALAFTVGRDIVFGAGQYEPESVPGRHLLAHELTHVVQQTAGAREGETAQRKLVEQRVVAPSLQARWSLERATPMHFVDANRSDENGTTLPLHTQSSVYGEAKTWQTTGFIHQHVGGQAQVAHWVTMHYVFRNDGTSNDMLELTTVGQLSGSAKAEDNHYARSGAAVWGGITERTAANPTPRPRQLFEIHDGGISAGIVRELGEIEVDVPFGEGGNVHVTIPLRYVSEGALAPFSQAQMHVETVAGAISEVDILLGARIEADADIETEFFGVAPWISRNYNISRAFGSFQLLWRNRPAPEQIAPPPGAAAYRCDAKCQENCDGEATRYLEGSSTKNCSEATKDAKSKAARGCYPRHCSCKDTTGFKGKGTQCEKHKG